MPASTITDCAVAMSALQRDSSFSTTATPDWAGLLQTACSSVCSCFTALTAVWAPFALLGICVLPDVVSEIVAALVSGSMIAWHNQFHQLLQSVTVSMQVAYLVNRVLSTGHDSTESASTSSSPDLMQLIAGNTDCHPRKTARIVKALLSIPSAARSISSDVLHKALMTALQQQNYPLVKVLLQVPAANAAMCITDNSGKGLISAAVTASAPSEQQLKPLMECLYHCYPLLRNPQLSEELQAVHLKERIAVALLDSAAAAGAAYSDLMAAVQHTTELLGQLDSEAEQYLTENQILAHLAATTAQNGHSTDEVEQLTLECTLQPVPQGLLLVQSLMNWSENISSAFSRLAALKAQKAALGCAVISLSAEQARLKKCVSHMLMPGQDQSVQQPVHQPTSEAAGSSMDAATALDDSMQKLRTAIVKGNLAMVKQLLSAKSVWEDLALNNEGSRLLLLAVPGSLAVFKALLEAVAAATQAAAAPAEAEQAEASLGKQRVSLAVSVSELGGPTFASALSESPGARLAPAAQEWVQELTAAKVAGDEQLAVACVKAFMLGFGHETKVKRSEMLLALLLDGDGSMLSPVICVASVFAVINSCAADLRQLRETADALETAMRHRQAHLMAHMAEVYSTVAGLRAQLTAAQGNRSNSSLQRLASHLLSSLCSI